MTSHATSAICFRFRTLKVNDESFLSKTSVTWCGGALKRKEEEKEEGGGVEIRRGWLQVTSVFEACIKSERGEVA